MAKREEIVEEEEDFEDRGDDYEAEDDEDLEEDEGYEDEEEDADEEESDEDEEEVLDDDEEFDDEEGDEDEEFDEDEDDEEEKDDDPRIPRSRLNEVIRQREEQKQEVAWLKEQLQLVLAQGGKKASEEEVQDEAPPFDFDGAEDQYIDLVLDGDKEQARKLRQQIDNERAKALQKEILKVSEKAESVATAKTAEVEAARKFETVLNKAVETYPFLNHKSKAYNEAAVKMANRIMAGYVAEGDSKDEALRKAVKDIVPMYSKTSTKGKERAKEARKKATTASKQQPTSAARSAAAKGRRDLSPAKIAKMSEKEFNSLTTREKAALRGD